MADVDPITGKKMRSERILHAQSARFGASCNPAHLRRGVQKEHMQDAAELVSSARGSSIPLWP